MTVSSTSRKVGPFNGNDVATAFPFAIKVFTTADLELTLTDADGVQTVLVLDSDYSISLNADQDNNPGGTITYPLSGSPLATGERIDGVDVSELEQSTDITNLGSFQPRVIEDAFDRVVIFCQQLLEKANRSLKYPVGDTASTTLPSAAERAGGSLAFDDDGNPIAGPALGDLATEVAAAAASANTAAAQATIATTQAGLAATARAAAETAETNAETAETNAETAQAAAEVARDAALAAARIYASTAAGVAAVANGEYFYVVSAPSSYVLELWQDVAGVATDTGKRIISATAVTDEILKTKASLGDVYALGTLTTVGSTAANTSTYPGGFTDTLFPQNAMAARGYLDSVSVRTAGGAGNGQIVIISPDANSQYGYTVTAVVAVTVADGVNTWTGASIYTGVLASGSRIGYRIVSGGTPRYAVGSPVKKITSSAQTAGQPLNGNLLDYVNDVAVSFATRPAPVTSLDERVSAIEGGTNTRSLQASAAMGEAISSVPQVTYGDSGLAPTAKLTSGYVFAVELPSSPCVLESVTFPVANVFGDPSGTLQQAQIAVGAPDATGNVIVSDVWTIYMNPGVSNTFRGFGDVVIPAGGYVMVTTTNARAGLQYQAGTSGGGGYFCAIGGALSVGSSLAMAAYSETPIFSYTVRQSSSAIGPRVTTLEDIQTLLNGTSDPVALERTEFPGVALPSGWASSGAWTVNNGLTPPAAGGWGVKTLNGTYSALWKHNQIARIKINSTDTITGLAQSPPENSGGAALLIDGVAGKLRLYSWDDTGAAGTLRAEVALPAALTAGREYILELQKVGFTITGTFKDTVTQQSCTTNIAGDATYTMAHGKCGALFISATTPPTYQWLEYLAPYPRKCRALIIADSIGEGAYLGAANPTWVQQVASARSSQNDVVIAPRAGDETPNFLLRKANDFDLWLPQFAVIALGTNDTDQSVWRTNVATLIAKAVANGAEPILCTQVPRTAAQALRTAMNSDIRSGYFGRYRYIDMAIAVSNAHDGVTWSATYDSGDGIHPNAAGQNVMYAQAQIDAPFLIR